MNYIIFPGPGDLYAPPEPDDEIAREQACVWLLKHSAEYRALNTVIGSERISAAVVDGIANAMEAMEDERMQAVREGAV